MSCGTFGNLPPTTHGNEFFSTARKAARMIRHALAKLAAARRQRRRDAGVCSECGARSAPFKTCAACRKYRREWIARRRAELQGKCCTVCRGKLAKTSENFCATHLAAQGDVTRARYHRRRRRRECTRCGSRTPPGRALCAAHAAQARAERQNSRRRSRRHAKTHQNANARPVAMKT
jgi:hypothetical protein